MKTKLLEQPNLTDARGAPASGTIYESIMETRSSSDPSLHRVLIIGGGAAGLELATQLGRRLGKKRKASITLVDRTRTHVWKPLLHEIASGALNNETDSVEFIAHARRHHYRYRIGEVVGLNRSKRQVHVAPSIDENGEQIIPPRVLGYEPLRPGQLHCAIVGAGATGVELAAELHKSMRDIASYNLDNIDFDKLIRITLIEAGPRILPALPQHLADSTEKLLRDLRVEIRCGVGVTEATADGVRLADGSFLPAELVVWAAGIKAPEFLKGLDALETDRINRLVVNDKLQTTRDNDIFAVGDCANCVLPGSDKPLPPRAQTAHQQATHMVKIVNARLKNQPLPAFRYRDFGSLVSLADYRTFGNVAGGLKIEGLIARVMYRSLYKMHLLAVHGSAKTFFETVAQVITRHTEPRIKLH